MTVHNESSRRAASIGRDFSGTRSIRKYVHAVLRLEICLPVARDIGKLSTSCISMALTNGYDQILSCVEGRMPARTRLCKHFARTERRLRKWRDASTVLREQVSARFSCFCGRALVLGGGTYARMILRERKRGRLHVNFSTR